MTEARDIAGFALPFTAGALLASMVPYDGICRLSCLAGTFLILTAALVSSRLFLDQRRFLQMSAIGITALCTGILANCAASACSISSLERITGIRAVASQFKEGIVTVIDSLNFQEKDTGALLKALLTGDRTSLSHEVTQAFRKSGAAHILALSGMHLGIIYGILVWILRGTGNTPAIKRLRSIILICACGFYTLATGAGESITRAFLFILLNEISGLTHRKTGLRHIMMAALIIQIAIDPTSVSSVGFQLSYAAIAGIAFIHPHLKGFWPYEGDRKGLMGRIWETASMSISCQMTTAPLAWYYFGSIPSNFLITNLIAIPLTTLTIPFSLICVVLQAAGICPQIMTDITEYLTTLMTELCAALSA